MSGTILRLCAGLCVMSCLTGCFSYVHHERGGSELSRLPIDENKPVSTIEWSTIWGGNIPVWEPVRCTYADGNVHYVLDADKDPQCKFYKPVCEQGVAKTQVSLLGYSLPLAIVTLGFAMPAELTVYCSTASEPGPSHGPSGPSGPE
jgi:hypothetical protein